MKDAGGLKKAKTGYIYAKENASYSEVKSTAQGKELCSEKSALGSLGYKSPPRHINIRLQKVAEENKCKSLHSPKVTKDDSKAVRY